MLRQAVQRILKSDWQTIIKEVSNMMDSELPGKEKKEVVFSLLREYGVACATWLLYAAIDIAYGKLKDEQG
jgi:predicted ArsR family transcriptional regulator